VESTLEPKPCLKYKGRQGGGEVRTVTCKRALSNLIERECVVKERELLVLNSVTSIVR